jgi:hypothetical protein
VTGKLDTEKKSTIMPAQDSHSNAVEDTSLWGCYIVNWEVRIMKQVTYLFLNKILYLSISITI